MAIRPGLAILRETVRQKKEAGSKTGPFVPKFVGLVRR
jgi:hypothetical protein